MYLEQQSNPWHGKTGPSRGIFVNDASEAPRNKCVHTARMPVANTFCEQEGNTENRGCVKRGRVAGDGGSSCIPPSEKHQLLNENQPKSSFSKVTRQTEEATHLCTVAAVVWQFHRGDNV